MNKRAIMYLVIIHTGSYDDYDKDVQFVTGSKEQAYLWANKFNKIIADNKSRMDNYMYQQGRDKLWYDRFKLESEADVEEVEYKY